MEVGPVVIVKWFNWLLKVVKEGGKVVKYEDERSDREWRMDEVLLVVHFTSAFNDCLEEVKF